MFVAAIVIPLMVIAVEPDEPKPEPAEQRLLSMIDQLRDDDRWTILAPPPRDSPCFRRHALQWRGRLVFASNGAIHFFHPPSGEWNVPLVLPHANGEIAVTADDTLYFLADDTSDVVLYRVEP